MTYLLDEIEQVCKKLQPIIGNRAKVLWYTYLTQDDKRRKVSSGIYFIKFEAGEFRTHDKILLIK